MNRENNGQGFSKAYRQCHQPTIPPQNLGKDLDKGCQRSLSLKAKVIDYEIPPPNLGKDLDKRYKIKTLSRAFNFNLQKSPLQNRKHDLI